MSKAIVVPVYDAPYVIDYEPGLKFLQAQVGGYIEAVDFEVNDTEYTLWLNEEGKILGLPYNGEATSMVSHRLFPNDYIAGQAVVTGGTGPEGETLPLTDEDVLVLNDYFVWS